MHQGVTTPLLIQVVFQEKNREHSFEVQSELEGHLKTCDGELLGVGLDCNGF